MVAHLKLLLMAFWQPRMHWPFAGLKVALYKPSANDTNKACRKQDFEDNSSDSRYNRKLHTRPFDQSVWNRTIVPTQSYVTTIYNIFSFKRKVKTSQ